MKRTNDSQNDSDPFFDLSRSRPGRSSVSQRELAALQWPRRTDCGL